MAESVMDNEQARLEALHRLEVLDTGPEAPFENIVSIVRTVLGVPMAAVTLVDSERQWFKAQIGLDRAETRRDISFCTHAVGQDVPFIIPDAKADARFTANPLVTGGPGIGSYAGAQLTTSDGFHVGTLCAIDVKPRDYSPAEVSLLVDFAKVVVGEIELHRRADRDPLTGALTRGAFMRLAAQEVDRHRRYGQPAALVLLDLDHFKRVNDTFGHGGGDTVLRRLGEVVQREIRPSDYFGRIGGEEFALLLPEVSSAEAEIAAERIRRRIAETGIELGGKTHRFTTSLGIAAIGARQGKGTGPLATGVSNSGWPQPTARCTGPSTTAETAAKAHRSHCSSARERNKRRNCRFWGQPAYSCGEIHPAIGSQLMTTRSAQARYEGLGKTGQGFVSTQSGVLSEQKYGFGTRFGDEPGTNPEELIAAAHASCFTMALSFALAGKGLNEGTLETSAKVTLEKDGDGFKVTRSDLTLKAEVPGISDEDLRAAAEGAKANCPISKLLNAEVSLTFA